MLVLFFGASFALTQKSAKPAFTSVYTDMKNDCKMLPEPPGTPEGGDPLERCKGFGGYRISISYSALHATLSIENPKKRNDSVDIAALCSDYGAKLEWRLANGKPFAVIVRLGKYKDQDSSDNPCVQTNKTGNMLVVKGLKGWEHINFEINGANHDANERAREMADQNYSKNK